MGSALTRAAVAAIAVFAVGLAALPGRAAADWAPTCGPYGPFDFDTYEFASRAAYNPAIELAAAGHAVAGYHGTPDETVDVLYQGLESGPRAARTAANPATGIPPTLYKSIVWIEANYANASAEVPFGGVGPVLRSFDCGFGLGQVTTGMANTTGQPTAKQAAVGTHVMFGLAEGVRILADKWNSAPQARPIAGTGDPAALEDWYYAVWSYNGFYYGNHPFWGHPLNPRFDPLRGGSEPSPLYHCYEPLAGSYQGGAFGYGDYPYQERVYGCMRYPPRAANGSNAPILGSEAPLQAWVPGDVLVVTGSGTGLNLRAEPTTSSAVLAVMPDGSEVTVLGGPVVDDSDGITWWNVQYGSQGGWAAEPWLAKKGSGPPPPPPDDPQPPDGPPPPPVPPTLPGARLWPPVAFFMPDFGAPAVAAAFQWGHFDACDNAGFAGGCPAMDFPTTIPERGVFTHTDPTPAIDPALAAGYLGAPSLSLSGPGTVTVTLTGSGTVTNQGAIVQVINAGTGVGPFRIRSTAPWLTVRHPGDAPSRTLDGGVAVGQDIQVTGSQSAGANSVLGLYIDPAQVTSQISTGTVLIEPLVGGGAAMAVTVVVVDRRDWVPLPNIRVLPGVVRH